MTPSTDQTPTKPTFTSEQSAALDGPDWLRQRRAAAAAKCADLVLPTSDQEEWRYSRIGDLDLDAFVPAGAVGDGPIADAQLVDRDVIAERAATVVVRNGRVVSAEISEAGQAQGLRVGRLAELPELEATLGSVVDDYDDSFVTLNDAHTADPVVIDIPRGAVLPEPIVISTWVDADGAGVFPRTIVRCGENAEATVVEWSGSAAVSAFVAPVTELSVGPAGRLTHLSIQDLGRSVTQVARTAATVDRDATARVGHAALGGSYARHRFDCALDGRGATGHLHALYLAGGDQMHDLRTFQHHAVGDTQSELVFKGALDDRSHAVYTGLIKIDPGARGSNATQANRIVKLSPDTWAESVPNLEIENNDVKCAHASAVGPIDPDQQFYLESRGLPPDVAERLVVAGFFEEVIESFGIPAVTARVRELVDARLGSA